MKKIYKIILVMLIFIITISMIPSYSNAFSLGDILDSGKDFLNQGGGATTVVAPKEEQLEPLSDAVSGILLTIAVVVTLISAVIMGINFVIQSVEDKAKIKESMVPWIIGIFVSFGAFGIWKITMGIFYQL